MVVFIVVLLSCGLLAFIGLQAVLHESDAQKKLAKQNLREALVLAVKQIEAGILDRVKTICVGAPLARLPLSKAACDTLSAYIDQSRYVESIFLVDRTDRVLYPRSFLASHPRDPPRNPAEDPFAGGERHEFESRYQDAIREYWEACKGARVPRLKAGLLCRIARCEINRGSPVRAAECYRNIIADERMHNNGEVLPPVVIAYTGLLESEAPPSRAAQRAELLIALYQVFLARFDQFDREQFDHYTAWIHEQFHEIRNRVTLQTTMRWEGLEAREKVVREECATAGVIQTNIIPRERHRNGATSGAASLAAVSDADRGTEWCYVVHPIERSSPIQFVGCLFRRIEFIEFVRQHLSSMRFESGGDLSLVSSMASSDSIHARIVLTAGFERLRPALSGFSVGLSFPRENPMESISSANLSVYYSIIIAMLTFALVGSVSLIRGVQREQELTKMKSEFIANVSHEIKTPIATIRALAENLHEGWVDDREKRAAYFKLIAQESERSSLLVSNILDFSRIEAGMKKYRFDVISVRETVERMLMRFRYLFEPTAVHLDMASDAELPSILADAPALEQAVLNLLDNAVKYSNHKNCIVLSIRSRGRWVLISVSDCGEGIPLSEQQNIFRKFYRLEAGNAGRATGSGIGLSIVKEIAEAHGGDVTVSSVPGEGSTFTIRIPIHPSS